MKGHWLRNRITRWMGVGALALISLSASCYLPADPPQAPLNPTEVLPATAAPRATARSATLAPSPTRSPLITQIPTGTPTRNPIRTPTQTPSLTPPPDYFILRGQVLVRANCRYGPGAPYLYKYGLVPGSNLEVIGRNDLGSWILVQAIGGNNPCWVKASLLAVQGDVMTVAPTYIPLPLSPYYPPLTGVYAARDGAEVVISWNGVALRAGDETAEAPYLVEAWVCTAGRLTFMPIGAYGNSVRVVDEPGCSEPSSGRIYLVEKHGYTLWVEIPWPPPG